MHWQYFNQTSAILHHFLGRWWLNKEPYLFSIDIFSTKIEVLEIYFFYSQFTDEVEVKRHHSSARDCFESIFRFTSEYILISQIVLCLISRIVVLELLLSVVIDQVSTFRDCFRWSLLNNLGDQSIR